MTTTNLHIYFVLDRSGSMESMANDVVGGFNGFLAEQQSDGSDALMTLIQFDSNDSHEVLADALPIADVPPLSRQSFAPRGGTPLYDAMGQAITDATIRLEQRRKAHEPDESILFVTFTDGEENQSVEYRREQLFDLIKKHEQEGWTFAYLGANQDAYAQGGSVGYAAASTQNFKGDAAGSMHAFASLSTSVSCRRGKMRRGEAFDHTDLFEGNKPAEADLEKRPDA